MPTISEYKEIVAEYKDYLDARSADHNISIWSILRNFFAGTFYRGRFSRYTFRDWLAGGVKSNFLFEWLPKSEHANFTSLIDRICKLDRDPSRLFEDIEGSFDQDFHGLVCILMEYFIKIQAQCNKRLMEYDKLYLYEGFDKNAVEYNRKIIKDYYAKTLRNLKKDINNLAQQHGVLRRIKKESSVGGTGLTTYATEKLEYDYYESETYTQKIANRAIATSNKRWAKVIAFLSGIAEGFINYVAVTGILAKILSVFAISLTLFSPWMLIAVPFIVAGLYTHYSFYKQGLYDGLKEIRRGNFYKEISHESGNYEKISWGTAGLVTVFSLLAVGGGFCGWALTSYSVSMAVMGSLCLSGMLIALPCAGALAFGLTFVYYCNIGKAIKKLDEGWKNLKKYLSDIKSIEDIPRVLLDILVLAIAAALMLTIGFVGYYLFRGKGVDILTTWNLCNHTSALIVSAVFAVINSIVKGFFGVKKIREIVNKFIDWMQFSEPEAQSVDKNPESQLDKSLASPNPIQIADQNCMKAYRWISYLSVFFNTGAKSLLYATAGANEFKEIGTELPSLASRVTATEFSMSVGACEFFYMGAPTTVTAAHRIKEDDIQIDNRAGFKRFNLFCPRESKAEESKTGGLTSSPSLRRVSSEVIGGD